MHFGLLGWQISHSYSPKIHSLLGSYPYSLFDVPPDQLGAFLRSNSFDGLNVTIPYKKSVIPFLTKLTPEAQMLGAVNTIIRRGDVLIGHNTDYFGFQSMIQQVGLSVEGKKVIVLGSGGASNTVTQVLYQLGAIVYVISRSGIYNYQNLHLHQDASIIVNTTPVGMYPSVGVSPVDLDLFSSLEAVLDVVYNPSRTKLLIDAESRGLITSNGLWMLVAQAKESSEWFSGAKLPLSSIPDIYQKLQKEMENIILIGMPGCGKTTTGMHLSSILGRQLIDLDAEVVSMAGCSIPEIFATRGEPAFRELETAVLGKYGKESGLIIATGGGSVIRSVNYDHLHQNGRLFWLTRDLHKLPTDGRPLSQSGSLNAMSNIRKPLYESFADHIISNDGAIEETVASIAAFYV